MNVVATKALVAILFGIIRFVFGILPIKVCSWLRIEVNGNRKFIYKHKQNVVKHGVAKLQSFGSGVLFATCLLHMMPQVYYSLQELKDFGILTQNYPYSQLIISLGFFLIYFVEEICQWFITRTPEKPFKSKLNPQYSASVISLAAANKVTPTLERVQNCSEDENPVKVASGNKNTLTKDEAVEVELDKHNSETNLNVELNEELEEIVVQVRTQQQVVRCIFIVLALSFHAIFEGLAIGLQHSVINIWYLFTAVSVHSATILFSIGLEIFLVGTRTKYLVMHMIFLALTSPIGVVIGLVISLYTEVHSKTKSIAVMILEGLSAGTILYITFFESLIREKQRRICIINRALYIGAGFTLMAGLECAKLTED